MGALDDLKNRKTKKDRKLERQAKLVKNGGPGTAVGRAIRWVMERGIDIAPTILDVAGTITGREGLLKLADKIEGDTSIPMADKEFLLGEIQAEVAQEQERTKRWEADMLSDSWLSKNIRPLVVANFTLLIDVVVISSIWGRPLAEAFLPLLMTMGVTAIGGYFTAREIGQNTKTKGLLKK